MAVSFSSICATSSFLYATKSFGGICNCLLQQQYHALIACRKLKVACRSLYIPSNYA